MVLLTFGVQAVWKAIFSLCSCVLQDRRVIGVGVGLGVSIGLGIVTKCGTGIAEVFNTVLSTICVFRAISVLVAVRRRFGIGG